LASTKLGARSEFNISGVVFLTFFLSLFIDLATTGLGLMFSLFIYVGLILVFPEMVCILLNISEGAFL
jgi:hypothetical protein